MNKLFSIFTLVGITGLALSCGSSSPASTEAKVAGAAFKTGEAAQREAAALTASSSHKAALKKEINKRMNSYERRYAQEYQGNSFLGDQSAAFCAAFDTSDNIACTCSTSGLDNLSGFDPSGGSGVFDFGFGADCDMTNYSVTCSDGASYTYSSASYQFGMNARLSGLDASATSATGTLAYTYAMYFNGTVNGTDLATDTAVDCTITAAATIDLASASTTSSSTSGAIDCSTTTISCTVGSSTLTCEDFKSDLSSGRTCEEST